MSKPTKKQLEDLANQIKRDQVKSNPAEKRLRINRTFKGSIKKVARTKPQKKTTH